MISQIVTLVGVIVGALTSYLATTRAERAKHHRLMATRWDERKLNTYVEYATCVKDTGAFAKRALQAEEGSAARQDFVAAMEQGELRRSALFEALVMLASPAAVEAAKELNLALRDRIIAARERTAVIGERDLVARLNDYHAAARLDLGISTGAIPRQSLSTALDTGLGHEGSGG